MGRLWARAVRKSRHVVVVPDGDRDEDEREIGDEKEGASRRDEEREVFADALCDLSEQVPDPPSLAGAGTIGQKRNPSRSSLSTTSG